MADDDLVQRPERVASHVERVLLALAELGRARLQPAKPSREPGSRSRITVVVRGGVRSALKERVFSQEKELREKEQKAAHNDVIHEGEVRHVFFSSRTNYLMTVQETLEPGKSLERTSFSVSSSLSLFCSSPYIVMKRSTWNFFLLILMRKVIQWRIRRKPNLRVGAPPVARENGYGVRRNWNKSALYFFHFPIFQLI